MKIAVVGSYGAGLTIKSDRMPALGETLGGGLFDYGPGGKGSNQAVGAARLGASVSILTALGDDVFAEGAHQLWKNEGIDAAPHGHLARTQSAEPGVPVGFESDRGLADHGPDRYAAW